MKVSFIHDGTLKYGKDGKYYGTAVTPKSLSRYRYLSDDITIVIRTQPFDDSDNLSRYTLIPAEYKIVHVDNCMSVKGILFNRHKVRKIIGDVIKESDLTICRFSGDSGKIAAQLCHSMHKPYIVECVGCVWDSLWNYNWKGKIIAPFKFFEQKRLIKQAPYVIYVTNEFLQKRYPTKGKYIAASNVELEVMNELNLSNRIKKIKEEMPSKVLTLGTAAAIDVPYKGQAYVLEAMSILKRQGITLRYQVIGSGDGKYLNDIAKKYNVEDYFEVLGTLPHANVFEWVDSLDIYVQPSDQEGLPRALIEAMSRACPAIGSSTAGIPELLEEKAIFKRRHVEQLCDVIKLMLDKETRMQQAKRNFNEALAYQRDVIYSRRNDFFDVVKKESNL